MKKLMPAAVVAAWGILGGCSSRTVVPAGPPVGARVADVGRVVIEVTDSIGAVDRKLLEEVSGASRLKTAIEEELHKAGKFDPDSARVLEIEVTEFRLRTGATVLWAGMLAGVDTLEIHATVREDDRALRDFETSDSTSGAFAGLSSSSRFQTMADSLAERVQLEL